jgi:rfaE bifunctional protein kinase chain/domain
MRNIFEQFKSVKALVVGDVMLDHYIFGQVNRISPEAPVPIVDIVKTENRLGGAANVAANLKALGATVYLASVTGDDDDGHILKELVQHHGISGESIVLDQDRITTVKSRVLCRNHQMLRFDKEHSTPLNENTELALLDYIIECISQYEPNVIVFQDYNKGVLSQRIIANTMHHARKNNIATAIDPKKDNFFSYTGCTLFKPNLREAAEGLGIKINPDDINSLREADAMLRAMINNRYTILTMSEKGIFVATPNNSEIIPSYQRNIVDVSGAGDTVISVMAAGLALGLDPFATAELANIAAGLVCEAVGVAPLNAEALYHEAAKFLDADTTGTCSLIHPELKTNN